MYLTNFTANLSVKMFFYFFYNNGFSIVNNLVIFKISTLYLKKLKFFELKPINCTHKPP